ncbi:GFA family protein [Ahrensia kielensis]|uniref:GFA family protein n=1 Tax=Ahrensia kielensis TaxID=76980 RepID=UPI0003795430|nr:DUF6151 family protein [Ahrensia kielensis]
MTKILCKCGTTALEVTKEPIMSVECLCDSCSKAASKFETLRGAQSIVTKLGGTHFVLYRKDRFSCVAGAENLKEFRLSPDAKTRRVVATCCNTPMFLEFEQGHWVSIYANLWNNENRPAIEMRTMTKDAVGVTPPDDVPNPKTHTLGFMGKLLSAWVAMGFRNPKIAVNGPLDI